MPSAASISKPCRPFCRKPPNLFVHDVSVTNSARSSSKRVQQQQHSLTDEKLLARRRAMGQNLQGRADTDVGNEGLGMGLVNNNNNNASYFSDTSTDSSSSICDFKPGMSTERAAEADSFSRCSWITLKSDPAYIAFHDEEWGEPVHDDKKLFELLVLSGALAEHCWSELLHARITLRKAFENFDPAVIAEFGEDKVVELASHKTMIFHQGRILGIIDNARLTLKIVKEFGSLSSYLWKFVGHKSIINKYRYAKQVPRKTPKAETISKDLLRRGFRYVGPMVIYSFMQAAGLTNDHQLHCFRWQQCRSIAKEQQKLKASNEKKVDAKSNLSNGKNGYKRHPEEHLQSKNMPMQVEPCDFVKLEGIARVNGNDGNKRLLEEQNMSVQPCDFLSFPIFW